ncbi:unnamed protein product [Auanema sp. JU1783]|nr:unnamed protein product [Auanema sp. JU1783]
MVAMEDDRLATDRDNRFIAEGLTAVNLRFLRTIEDFENGPEYAPEFVHQHFGENETIFGYENLKVVINYTDANIYFYPEVSYDKDITIVDKDIKPDNVIMKLREQLPEDQMNVMVTSKPELFEHFKKNEQFKPYGTLQHKFENNGNKFEIYKVDSSSEEFDFYLSRVQTLALWYIDAAQYTDNTDPRWVHYFIYESRPSLNGDGTFSYALAGYASLYRFYAYPSLERPRVAQILLLPKYRRGGNGAKFLQAIYNDLKLQKEVLDVTAEDPADNFIYLRDYVDCINCLKLKEFSAENLANGYSDEMKEAAVKKLKINKRQSRRVYEILRLMHTDMKNPVAAKSYRIDVKRRLELPMKRSAKDWRKINHALDSEEVAQVAAAQLDSERKFQLLQSLYESETEVYKITINRIKTFPTI